VNRAFPVGFSKRLRLFHSDGVGQGYSAGRLDALDWSTSDSEGIKISHTPVSNDVKDTQSAWKLPQAPALPSAVVIGGDEKEIARFSPKSPPSKTRSQNKEPKSPTLEDNDDNIDDDEEEEEDGSVKDSVRSRRDQYQEHHTEKRDKDTECRIHVWDLGADVAPTLGLPRCNITDIWTFDQPGNGIEGMYSTRHQDAPHSVGFWVADAVRRSRHYETNIKYADIILLDTHCYESWYFALQQKYNANQDSDSLNPINELSLQISKLFVEGVMVSPQFLQSKGKKFALVRPTLGAPPGAMLDTCAKFRSSFLIASERGIFCDNDRDRAFHGQSVIAPLVASLNPDDDSAVHVTPLEERQTLLYLPIPCSSSSLNKLQQRSLTEKSASAVLLDSVEQSISNPGDVPGGLDDVVVVPRQEICSISTSRRAKIIEGMRSARFCGILPSEDRQADVFLPLAIQAGCVPVFLGPPFHSMPLALDIDYSSIAIFVHIVDHTKSIWKIDELSMQDGDLEPDQKIRQSPVEVPSVIDAIRHLRNIPATHAQSMFNALNMERERFVYDSTSEDSAGNTIIKRMCEHSKQMKQNSGKKLQVVTPQPSKQE
jgi:hypothetical protein